MYRRTISAADMLRKRLALFHPSNLDNSLYVGIDKNALPAMDYILCIYTVKGVSCFLYSHTGSPEPNGEYSTNWLTLLYMSDLRQRNCLRHEPQIAYLPVHGEIEGNGS